MVNIKIRNIAILVLVCLGLFVLGVLSMYAYGYKYDSLSIWVGGREAKFEAVMEINSYTNSFGGIGGNYRTVSYHWGKLTNNHTIARDFLIQGGSRYDWEGDEIDFWDCDPANGLSVRRSESHEDVPANGGIYSFSFNLTNSHSFAWPSCHQVRAFTTCSSPELIGTAYAYLRPNEAIWF